MKAIIMLNADENELKPLTQTKPKGMLEIFDKPILYYLVEHFRKNNITEYIFVVGNGFCEIEKYFGNGEEFGVSIVYVKDGPVLISDNNFIFIPSPVVTDIDILKAVSKHEKEKNKVTAVLCESVNNQIIETDSEGNVIQSNINGALGQTVTGIYIINREFLENNPEFPYNFENQIDEAVLCSGYFYNIKSFDDYLTCAYDLLDGEMELFKSKNGVVFGENTFIEVGAKIKPPVYIGENSHIEKDAEIMPYSIIGKNSRIEEEAHIENSIVLPNVLVRKNAELSGCVIGENSVVGQGAKLYSGSVVGEYTKIGKEVVVSANVSIFNEKFIENNLIVTEDVITGAAEPNIKFKNGKITGDHIFTLSIENAVKIGAIFGIINSGYPVGLFRDDNGASEMIANSISAGLKSVGSLIYVFSDFVYGMCKTACPFYSLNGGIFVYTENDMISIEFFSKDGANISRNIELKIEGMLGKNEIPVVTACKIPKTIQMANYKHYYYSDIVKRINIERLSTHVVLEKTSQPVLDYIRKMAVLYNITLIPVKKSGVNSFIRAQISASGKELILWDENGQKLTNKQMDEIMAIILSDEISAESYVCHPDMGEAVKMFLSDMEIESCGGHPSDMDRAMLKIANKEQFYMVNDPVYFFIKILFYLKVTVNTLAGLVEILPKTYFIKSTNETVKGGFEATVAKIVENKNDGISKKIKNKNK